ncbi:protein ripply2 [Pelodiscus sinensis]|uniref:protein ripply2 n=1 Tax=Pelodiscus sinensis TaxID=13735 RepID=UPI0003C4C4A0|nr:protein ripply2 [Pelodiscus sinensis]|eukprot:XP_025045573.1 protein ripply2 [Pelodiscus sinensis]
MESARIYCCPPHWGLSSGRCSKGQHGAGEFWRPWIPNQRDAERQMRKKQDVLHSPYGMTEASGKCTQYTHPVRLFWPKSRCYDYLYQEAEALLKNFPVQATISFYEDSDSEDDNVELEQDSGIESDC